MHVPLPEQYRHAFTIWFTRNLTAKGYLPILIAFSNGTIFVGCNFLSTGRLLANACFSVNRNMDIETPNTPDTPYYSYRRDFYLCSGSFVWSLGLLTLLFLVTTKHQMRFRDPCAL